ncbi:MAG: ATP-dependent 6-phosphofructokinase [Phycisphaerales bacterium]|nr:MAG: ATP-dependent 6-phosphofructokinase [Phycisphaerales bacterium]
MFENETQEPVDFTIQQLGPRKIASPYKAYQYVSDDQRTLYHTLTGPSSESLAHDPAAASYGFELAGPREKIYFDPSKIRCGIVTCGGLCPGLNNVIRAIVLQLYHHYGVRNIYGFQYGFEGLVPRYGHEALILDHERVKHIHQRGGSILASSRGPQSPEEMVDALERLNIQVLFCIGGDGTLRGALKLCSQIQTRNLKIGVIGVPKTIDNDIPYTSRTFGFETAYAIAAAAIRGAHVEATGARNGIGLLKLMGRHAGFIAANAVLASRDANFVLVPEVPFELGGENGFLPHLYRRLEDRKHAVVVVAEGAGQDLIQSEEGGGATDASGNIRLKDIGVFLRDKISEYLKAMGMEFTLKYIEPSYLIRSAPPQANDALFAGILGQMAAHAAMAGKTAMFVGYWNNQFTYVPIAAAVSRTKRLDPRGNFWESVIECTGQPRMMVNSPELLKSDRGSR